MAYISEVVLIFEVIFILEVPFIFEVIFIFKVVSNRCCYICPRDSCARRPFFKETDVQGTVVRGDFGQKLDQEAKIQINSTRSKISLSDKQINT